MGSTTANNATSWNAVTGKQLTSNSVPDKNHKIDGWHKYAQIPKTTPRYQEQNRPDQKPSTLWQALTEPHSAHCINKYIDPEFANRSKKMDEKNWVTVYKTINRVLNKRPLVGDYIEVVREYKVPDSYVDSQGWTIDTTATITNCKNYFIAQGDATSASFNAQATLLALITSNSGVSVWDVAKMFKALHKGKEHTPKALFTTPNDIAVNCASFSPDNKHLITATRTFKKKNFISMWDLAQKTRVCTFAVPGEEQHITSLAMHPNGGQLVAGSSHHGYLWQFTNPQELESALGKLTDDQKKLLAIISQGIKNSKIVTIAPEQLETFHTLPKDFQAKLQAYITSEDRYVTSLPEHEITCAYFEVEE